MKQQPQQWVLPKPVPITFAESIISITVTPLTPPNLFKSLQDYDLNCTVFVSRKNWHPNYNAQAYHKRRDERKKEKQYDNH